jgi:hypothetical protein
MNLQIHTRRTFFVGGVTLTLTLVWTSLTIFAMSREIEEMRSSRIRDAEKLATLSNMHNDLRNYLAASSDLPSEDAAQTNAETADTEQVTKLDKGRRLGATKTIVASASNTASSGCLSITAAESLVMSSTTCKNSKRCPTCVVATALSANVDLEIVACSTQALSNNAGSSSAVLSNKISEYTFINQDDAQTLTIKAAATASGTVLSQYALAPLESVVAYCVHTTGAQTNILHFPFQALTPASNSKKAWLDNLGASDPGGDITWDTNTGGAGDSRIIAGSKTATEANNMQALSDNLATAPDNAVTFTTGAAITVGFGTTTHGYLLNLGASDPGGDITWDTNTGGAGDSRIIAGFKDATEANNMQALSDNLATAPDNAVTFTTGAVTVGFASGTHTILSGVTCTAANINAGTCPADGAACPTTCSDSR